MRVSKAVIVECDLKPSAPGRFHNLLMSGCDTTVSDDISVAQKSLRRRGLQRAFRDQNRIFETIAGSGMV
jgi:hypothetical protein